MELKRILARDTRSAMEQAIKTYGPDVLVISNHQVAGQTELVVAIEVPLEATDERPSSPQTRAADAGTDTLSASFRDSFQQVSQSGARASQGQPAASLAAPVLAERFTAPCLATPVIEATALPATLPATSPATSPVAAPIAAAVTAPPAASAPAASEQDAREYLRSREIVDRKSVV